MLAKEGMALNNVKRLPSGRGIAAMYDGLWLINIYEPSRTARLFVTTTFLPATRHTHGHDFSQRLQLRTFQLRMHGPAQL